MGGYFSNGSLSLWISGADILVVHQVFGCGSRYVNGSLSLDGVDELVVH